MHESHRMPEHQFQKHFTVAEANALLPHVLSVFERIHALGAELATHQVALESIHERTPGNGGSAASAEMLVISDAITRLMSDLEDKGILIKDVQTGLIDFPHLREDREVLLCWRMGEKSIEFWHEIEAGFRGRQPL